MGTTTPGAAGPGEDQDPGVRRPPWSTPADGTRLPHGEPRLIHNESTTEIPVHLLFRDDQEPAGTGGAAGVSGPFGAAVPQLALGPAVVGRRRGTGEQPRTPARRAGAGGDPAGDRRAEPRGNRRTDPVGDRRADSGRGARKAAAEAGLVPSEFPARVLPGGVGLLLGVAGVAGAVLALWWAGVLPALAVRALGLPPGERAGLGSEQWAALGAAVALTLAGFGGLGRGRVGGAWVLTHCGRYRGSVRCAGLYWTCPWWLRRRVDVRLRHWRSEPTPAVDAEGTGLRVVVLVVWRVRDTVRAALGVESHEAFLRECVESALARVLSRFPADSPLGPGGARVGAGPTLRNAEAVGGALTRLLAAEVEPVGLQVFSAQPVRIEYAPEVAAAMQRSRIAALDARHRDSVLTSVVDSVEDTVSRLTVRGLVELDDYERKALVKDLTVAFWTGRGGEA